MRKNSKSQIDDQMRQANVNIDKSNIADVNKLTEIAGSSGINHAGVYEHFGWLPGAPSPPAARAFFR